MTCNDCQNAIGKMIMMCEIFNAPCYDPYANIDGCADKECRYFVPREGDTDDNMDASNNG